MDKVHSVEEAKDWFISHSSGSVMCSDGTSEKVCDCYPEAVEFYDPRNVKKEETKMEKKEDKTMGKNDDGPAFPRPFSEDGPDHGNSNSSQTGMSLRQYYAGKAMEGFIIGLTTRRATIDKGLFNQIIDDSFKFADAMIEKGGD